MYFRIISEIEGAKTIATGRTIRELRRLNKVYGKARWRKRKGTARIKLNDGTIAQAELHWYEAHGVGRKEFKVKRFLQDAE